VRVSDFSLWAHQAFCFTNPTFEAVDSILSEVVAIKLEYKNGRFLTMGTVHARHAYTGIGQGLEFLASVAE